MVAGSVCCPIVSPVPPVAPHAPLLRLRHPSGSCTVDAKVNTAGRQLTFQCPDKASLDCGGHREGVWEPQDSVSLFAHRWLQQSAGRNKSNCYQWLPHRGGISIRRRHQQFGPA